MVFSTAGHGIDLEGQDYSLSKNLVVLMTQSAWSPVWVAGIKVNKAKNTHLHGNVVAGSENLVFTSKATGVPLLNLFGLTTWPTQVFMAFISIRGVDLSTALVSLASGFQEL